VLGKPVAFAAELPNPPFERRLPQARQTELACVIVCAGDERVRGASEQGLVRKPRVEGA
jgi:hypothetical protein